MRTLREWFDLLVAEGQLDVARAAGPRLAFRVGPSYEGRGLRLLLVESETASDDVVMRTVALPDGSPMRIDHFSRRAGSLWVSASRDADFHGDMVVTCCEGPWRAPSRGLVISAAAAAGQLSWIGEKVATKPEGGGT